MRMITRAASGRDAIMLLSTRVDEMAAGLEGWMYCAYFIFFLASLIPCAMAFSAQADNFQ